MLPLVFIGINCSKRTQRLCTLFYNGIRQLPKLVCSLYVFFQQKEAKRVKMSFLELGTVVFGSTDEQIDFLQAGNLISRQPNCPTCGSAMSIQVRNDLQDKQR